MNLSRRYFLMSTTFLAGLARAPTLNAWTRGFTPPKTLLAYYLIATATYGYLQANFQQDILDARALGIDGFVIGVEGWATGNFQTWTAALFSAAVADGNGFKLAMSPELGDGVTGINSADIIAMVNTYKAHPNYLQFNGKPFLTTDGGQAAGQAFWNTVFASTGAMAFYPGFDISGTSGVTFAQPTYAQTLADWVTNFPWWPATISGLGYFTFGGLPANLVPAEEGKALVMAQYSRLYCAGMSAYYSQTRYSLVNQTTYEMLGGEGLQQQWSSIFATQKPTILILYTWCDVGESYITPANPANIIRVQQDGTNPPLHPHVGFANLDRYFISYWKGGVPPPIVKDELFYFYRIQPGAISLNSFTIIGATWSSANGGTITYTTSINHGYLVTSSAQYLFNAAGFSPSGYNQSSVLMSAPSANTLAVSGVSNPGAVSIEGTLKSATGNSQFFSLQDTIFVTSILTAPATVRVINNGVTTDTSVAAGLINTRVSFVPGAVEIKLIRSGATLIDLTGESIVSSAFNYDMNPTTGYGSNP